MTDLVAPRRALISVSDKTGLIELAEFLVNLGVEICSTGGSAKAIKAAGLAVTEVSDLTQFPEMMDGRVKTLHPAVHGGLLALRDDQNHVAAMEEHNIQPIDLLVVNLYPFEETVQKGADYDTCIENIDIGGPAMIRAAAKNHGFVTTLVDVSDYDALKREMGENNGQISYAFRQKMASIAYARTASYDSAVSQWFAAQIGDKFPKRMTVSATHPIADMVKILISQRPLQMALPARALPLPYSIRAKRFLTTISMTQTLLLNWQVNLIQVKGPSARLSNTQIPAALLVVRA